VHLDTNFRCKQSQKFQGLKTCKVLDRVPTLALLHIRVKEEKALDFGALSFDHRNRLKAHGMAGKLTFVWVRPLLKARTSPQKEKGFPPHTAALVQ
jgi:hypothetical protein